MREGAHHDGLVTVADRRSEELFIIPVASHEALDAFRHPFRYAGAPALDAVAVQA